MSPYIKYLPLGHVTSRCSGNEPTDTRVHVTNNISPHRTRQSSQNLLKGTQRQFLENISTEDDLISRIFGTFVVKFLACLPLLGFSNV